MEEVFNKLVCPLAKCLHIAGKDFNIAKGPQQNKTQALAFICHRADIKNFSCWFCSLHIIHSQTRPELRQFEEWFPFLLPFPPSGAYWLKQPCHSAVERWPTIWRSTDGLEGTQLIASNTFSHNTSLLIASLAVRYPQCWQSEWNDSQKVESVSVPQLSQ